MSAERNAAGYLLAGLLALPAIGAVWFEAGYLWFGVTAQDPPPAFSVASLAAAAALALVWPFWRASGSFDVVRRVCGLGLVVSLLLPVVALAVLMLWQVLPARPDFGMGGLMLYAMPVVAFVAASVLGLVYGLVGRWAKRRLARAALLEPKGP